MTRLDKVKQIIKENYDKADSGLFFSRNFVGDPMANIYSENNVDIDICYYYSYFEVFGLTKEEQEELKEFYYAL